MYFYSGKYSGVERQIITNQNRLERLLNWLYIIRYKIAFLPLAAMMAGAFILYISANVLERLALSAPIFSLIVTAAVLAVIPSAADWIVDTYYFRHPTRAEVEHTLGYIARHPYCAYDDIVQACISPKIYYLSDEIIILLQHSGLIYALMDEQHKAIYHLTEYAVRESLNISALTEAEDTNVQQ